MNTKTKNNIYAWLVALAPLNFALGIFGAMFSFAGQFKIDECYYKASHLGPQFNFTSQMTTYCNDGASLNSALWWLSCGLIVAAILSVIIMGCESRRVAE